MTSVSSDNRDNGAPTDEFASLSFDELLQKLEEIVQQLEMDRLSLEASIDTYETGMRVAQRCQRLLEQAELRISRIASETGETEPYEASAFDIDDEER